MQLKNKREQQRQERRQQILECSLDMIISRGFEAMKIRDIAGRLGISVGLFFNYFQSKEQVYEELIKIGLSGPARMMEMNVEGIEPILLFEKITQTIFEALKEDSITRKMFLLMAQTLRWEAAPEGVKKLLEGFDSVTPLLAVIKRGQALGQLKPGDPAALAVAYWGAVQGIAENCAMYADLPLPQSDWVVDIIRA
jgi:AcrR family transcriptional regulator